MDSLLRVQPRNGSMDSPRIGIHRVHPGSKIARNDPATKLMGEGWVDVSPQWTICRKFRSLVGFLRFEFLLFENFDEK